MSREKQIEEMIDALKKCSCVYTDCEQECAQCSNEELYDDTLNHIARTLYEAGYRKQEWISVNERLPEECTHVIVHDEDGTVGEAFHSISDHFEWVANEKMAFPTHWMHLPEPPKGE